MKKQLNITLGNYQNFVSIENPQGEYALMMLYGIDRLTLRSLPQDKVSDMIDGVDKLAGVTEWDFIPTFKLDGVTYGFIPDLDNISYGENKDICKYISNWETMHNAMAALYRPIKTNMFGRPKIVGGKYQIEDYEGTVKTAEIMKKMPLEVCFGAHVFFLQFNERIAELYPELYGSNNGEGPSAYAAKWGDYQEVYTLAREDIRRFDEVTKLPLHSCLLYLSFKVDEAAEMNKRIKKQKR